MSNKAIQWKQNKIDDDPSWQEFRAQVGKYELRVWLSSGGYYTGAVVSKDMRIRYSVDSSNMPDALKEFAAMLGFGV